MRSIFVSLLIILNVCFVINGCGERKVNLQGLITDGYQTKPGEWPFHAAIFHSKRKNSAYACGGTVISEYAILTAVHCTRDSKNTELSPEVIKVQVGKFKLWESSTETQYHSVLRIAAHENYDKSTFKNDIALLILETKITYSNFIQPACLWSNDDWRIHTVVGQLAVAVGWGWTQDEDQEANELMAANLPIVGDIECLNKSPDIFGNTIFEGSFCAGFSNGTSVCNGDSGGGLYLKVKNSWFLRGIVSFTRTGDLATNKCDPKELVGFVNVAYYVDWIYSNMKTRPALNVNDEILTKLAISEIKSGRFHDAVDIFTSTKTNPYVRVIEDVYRTNAKNVEMIRKFINAFPMLQQQIVGTITLYETMRRNRHLDTFEALVVKNDLEEYTDLPLYKNMPSLLKVTANDAVENLEVYNPLDRLMDKVWDEKIQTENWSKIISSARDYKKVFQKNMKGIIEKSFKPDKEKVGKLIKFTGSIPSMDIAAIGYDVIAQKMKDNNILDVNEIFQLGVGVMKIALSSNVETSTKKLLETTKNNIPRIVMDIVSGRPLCIQEGESKKFLSFNHNRNAHANDDTCSKWSFSTTDDGKSFQMTFVAENSFLYASKDLQDDDRRRVFNTKSTTENLERNWVIVPHDKATKFSFRNTVWNEFLYRDKWTSGNIYTYSRSKDAYFSNCQCYWNVYNPDGR